MIRGRKQGTAVYTFRPGISRSYLLLLLSVCSAWTSPVKAADPVTLSPVAIFERCYGHLTRQRVPLGNTLRMRVSRGEITAVDACMEVYNAATLDTTGLPSSGKPEAEFVLNTFNDFHRTWFPADDMDMALNEFSCARENHELLDPAEAALHFTRAAFGTGVQFKEAFTSTLPMEAIRSQGPIAGGTVHAGRLQGIRVMSATAAAETIASTVKVSGSPAIIRHKESLGGGFMGTRSFLALNLGAARVEQRNDGGIDMPRRWSKAALETSLCRSLPILRQTDVQLWVNTSSTIPFRKSSSCMTCHATMDSFAGAARNATVRLTSRSCYVAIGPKHASVTFPGEPLVDAEPPPPDSDLNFGARPPSGRLYFRSFDGTLKDIRGEDLKELALQLVEHDDVYVCAAKRYFEYFTGISVSLQDPGDPELPPISAADQHYRDQVIQMGKALKSTNNMRTLIQSILASPVYAKPYITAN